MKQLESIRLFSVGHSNVALERFVGLLDLHGIATVCDVRSVPYSRYTPHFNRESLVDALPNGGISYHWFGDTLGGMPQDPSLRLPDGRADTAKIAATASFQHGLTRLIAFGRRAPTAFMCAEADYHGCHRNRLITPALLEQHIEVLHIMADGTCEHGVIAPEQLTLF